MKNPFSRAGLGNPIVSMYLLGTQIQMFRFLYHILTISTKVFYFGFLCAEISQKRASNLQFLKFCPKFARKWYSHETCVSSNTSWRLKVVSIFGFGHPKSLFLHLNIAISEIDTICEGTIQILSTLMSCCRKINVFFVLLALFFLQIYCVENKYYSPSKNQNMRIYSSSCCFSRSMCICQTGLRVWWQ